MIDSPPKVTASALEPIDLEGTSLEVQKSIMRQEAVASFQSRNLLRESVTSQAAIMIRRGQDPSKLLDLLDRLSKPDEFTEKVLNKLV